MTDPLGQIGFTVHGPGRDDLAAYAARLAITGIGDSGLCTFGQWLAARPFGDGQLPRLDEAVRLEWAFTAGMRHGIESSPPLCPVPGDAPGDSKQTGPGGA